MLPGENIRSTADRWVENHLHRPYLALHVRRGDFVAYARKDTTPELENVGRTINALVKEHQFKSVFVATDATKDEKVALSQISPIVTFFRYDLGHPGVNALVEQWVCAVGDHFVGTKTSRFSLNIQEERDLIGFPSNKTWNHFCKEETHRTCEKQNWYTFEKSPIRVLKYGHLLEQESSKDSVPKPRKLLDEL
mmetsp:Transcript_15339/g.23225  ORF Transcript_15339/g.23225 Transcript_15339/m.23225 type:complete len:193 (+) Transcript_15339:791-1369(+)